MPSWFSKPTEERPQTPRVDEPSTKQVALEEVTSRVLLLQRLLRGRAAQNVMHEGKATRQALITELREADKSLQDPDEAAADAFETRATMVKLAGTDHAAGATVSKLLSGLGTEGRHAHEHHDDHTTATRLLTRYLHPPRPGS